MSSGSRVVVAIAGAGLLAIALWVLGGGLWPRRAPPATYAEAREVVDRRCVPCHARTPTSLAFPIAPKEVVLDTAEEMVRHAARIRARAVVEKTMPLANMSGMTESERAILGSWVDSGAPAPTAPEAAE